MENNKLMIAVGKLTICWWFILLLFAGLYIVLTMVQIWNVLIPRFITVSVLGYFLSVFASYSIVVIAVCTPMGLLVFALFYSLSIQKRISVKRKIIKK